jgi:hypothetical protein
MAIVITYLKEFVLNLFFGDNNIQTDSHNFPTLKTDL